MRIRSLAHIILGSLTSLLFIACPPPTGSAKPKVTISFSASYSPSSPIVSTNFSNSDANQITLTGLSNSTVYLVKLNTSADSGATAADTGSLGSELLPARAATGSATPVTSLEKAAYAGPPSITDKPEVTAFNSHPPLSLQGRNTATGLSRNVMTPLGIEPSATVGYGTNASYAVGTTTKSFWVQNSGGSWVQITATLRAMGQYCYVWIPDSNFNNGSGSSSDDALTQTQINALMTAFDGTSGTTYKDGIYFLDTNVFGYEYGGGSGGSGGKDGDQHVSILLYDLDGDYYPSQTGGLFGYFWGKDEYDQSVLDAAGVAYKSNLSEIFYLDVHFTDHYPLAMNSTLAHEFQHMIQFNQKVINHGVVNSTWLNELCSMVAEDLLAAPLGTGTYAPKSRFNEFNYHYAESGVTYWSSSGTATYKSYAGAYAFGAFLLRNYGGPALFHEIVTNNHVDTASVTQALATLGYSDTFTSALQKYTQALVYQTAPSGSGVKTLNQSGSWTYPASGGASYTVEALSLWDFQEYNLDGSGWVTSGGGPVYGPRSYDPGDTSVLLRPAGVVVMSKPAWQNLTGSITLTLNKPNNSAVQLILLVK